VQTGRIVVFVIHKRKMNIGIGVIWRKLHIDAGKTLLIKRGRGIIDADAPVGAHIAEHHLGMIIIGSIFRGKPIVHTAYTGG